MQKLLLIIPFFLSSFYLNAQTNLDSLYSVWQDESQVDSIRLVAYSDYIWEGFIFSNPDTALLLAKELLNYADDKNYPDAKATGYHFQGVAYYLQGNYPKALDYYTQGLAIYQQLGSQKGIASSLNNIGNIYKLQGNYPKTLDYYTQSLAIETQLSDKKGVPASLNNIGNVYKDQGDYSEALDYYTQSLTIYKQLNNQRGVSMSLNNIGIIYEEQEDYSKALDYYTKSLAIDTLIGDQRGTSMSLNNIGIIYEEQEDYSKALDYYTQSLAIKTQLGDQRGTAISLNNIGVIYHNQGNYSKALSFCQKGYKTALAIEALEEQKSGCQCLFNTYKAMSKGNKALMYMEKIQVINDSLNTQETTKQLERMEFQKQMFADSIARANEVILVKQKEKEMVEAKNRKNQIQYSLVALVVFLLAAILVSMTKLNFNPKIASALIFIFFILIFEFVLVILDPFVDTVTDGEVGFKIGINSIMALIIFSIHQISEKRIKKILIKQGGKR